LLDLLSRYDQPWNSLSYARTLLQIRPQALIDAVEIVITRPDAVRRVLLRHSYTDPAWVGGYLDQALDTGSTQDETKADSTAPEYTGGPLILTEERDQGQTTWVQQPPGVGIVVDRPTFGLRRGAVVAGPRFLMIIVRSV
jgi:hypothetical protein